jgi:hypothetical protein
MCFPPIPNIGSMEKNTGKVSRVTAQAQALLSLITW